MKEEQGKVFLQWLIPAACVVIVIMVMFFNFSNKTKREAIETFESDMMEIADRYALKVNSDLHMLQVAGKTAMQVIEAYEKVNPPVVDHLLRSLVDNTTAFNAIYCDADGRGVDKTGTGRDMMGFSYYLTVKNVVEPRYIYLEDDGISEGSAILLIIPAEEEDGGKLLIYYPLERIKSLAKMNMEFDSESFMAFINVDGTIIQTGDIRSSFLEGDNLWENVDSYSNNAITKARVRIQNMNSGCLKAETDTEARTLIYSPIKINEWALVIGVNQSYVDKREMQMWNNTSRMLYQLLAVIVVFLCTLMGINVISKIRSVEKNKMLQEKADTDLLTGLYNKLATERRIKEYIAENPDSLAMMFVLDIDNFKKVNDTMGHAFGDEVLRSLGKQISSVFRVTDVVGRTGGDEFTIFLKFLKDDANTVKEAKKLTNFFKEFVTGEYVKYSATASIGAAVFPAHGKDFETLYKSADKALYKAKQRGKNQLAFYDDRDRQPEEKCEKNL